MLLAGATLADGRRVDVRLAGDRISAVADAGTLAAGPDEPVVDLAGHVLLPAPAEPHAHLDKALTADRVPNPDGDLMGAIRAWLAYRPTLAVDDIADRAERAVRMLVANGVTAIRTHVDVGFDIGARGIEALIGAGGRSPTWPTSRSSPSSRPRRRVPPAPATAPPCATPSTPAPTSSAAARTSSPIRCRPSSSSSTWRAAERTARRPPHRRDPRPAGPPPRRRGRLRRQDGLPLRRHRQPLRQPRDAAGSRPARRGRPGRGGRHRRRDAAPDQPVPARAATVATATPRGLTALRPLLDAGVTLAAGADNLQDPFNVVGRGDPFETAALLVMAGHLTPR